MKLISVAVMPLVQLRHSLKLKKSVNLNPPNCLPFLTDSDIHSKKIKKTDEIFLAFFGKMLYTVLQC